MSLRHCAPVRAWRMEVWAQRMDTACSPRVFWSLAAVSRADLFGRGPVGESSTCH